MAQRLLSMGQILRGNLCIYGDQNTLTFAHVESKEIMLRTNSTSILENIFWVDTQIITGSALIALSTIHEDSYETWHRRLGHPSDQVFTKFKTQTKHFPSDLTVPPELPICKGCAKGKMHSRSFLENPIRTTKPFQRIHSDLREYPVLSYSKFKYYISFLDDCTSHGWVVNLRKKKSKALKATEQFIAMIKTQYGVAILEWFTDNGGEYVDDDLYRPLEKQWDCDL